MRKNVLICLMVIATAIAFMPTGTFATSKKVKMTTYTVYKTGSTAYCAGDSGLYKVKIKKGKVRSKKKVVTTGAYEYVDSLKKKGNYLYYIVGTEGTTAYLCRAKISGGKPKTLAYDVTDFAIKGKKIYYSSTNWDENDREVTINKVMKLNGKGKKKTSVRAVETVRHTNTKGYKLKSKIKGKYAIDHLKTPKGTFYLGKTKKYDVY